MICDNCNKIIPDDSVFCGYCGNNCSLDIKNENANPSKMKANNPEINNFDNNISYGEWKQKEKSNENKYDTAEIKKSPEIIKYDDPYVINNSFDHAVLPAGIKVINKYNRPFKTSTFFWTQVILLIPIVNIVLLFAWAFRKNSNENRKAYARSILLWISVVILALFIGTIVLWALGYPIDIGYWKNELKLAINSL